PSLKEGVHALPGADVGGHRHDAAVFVTADQVVSFVYPVEERRKREFEELKAFGLTPSELEICVQALDGHANREICKHLCISVATLKTHLNNVYKKIPVNAPIRASLLRRG